MDNRAKRYPADARAAAVALFRETGDAQLVAAQVGADEESVRVWWRQTETPGATFKATQRAMRRVIQDVRASAKQPAANVLQSVAPPRAVAAPAPVALAQLELQQSPDGLVSLNDLYEAAKARGMAEGKLAPRQWRAGPGREFIEFQAAKHHVAIGDIIRTSRAKVGQGGGTFAHWQVALAYAKYLSHELHARVNEVFVRATAGDVTLAAEIADKASPQDQAWLTKRVEGTVARKALTTTLAEHGVAGKGYAMCTNATYGPLLGGSKSEVLEARGIAKRDTNLRDVLSTDELAAVGFAEIVARRRIIKANTQGNEPCASECGAAASDVAALLH